MDWIDRRLAERRLAGERLRIVGDGADHLWSNLCGALRQSVITYNERVKREVFESSPISVDVSAEFECSTAEGESMWVQVKPGHPRTTETVKKRKVTIGRDKRKQTISAAYETQENSIDSTPIELSVGVNEAQQACLMHDRHEISAVTGAELILDRILFPDLPRPVTPLPG
jgi:hypothetical protein